jgi:hypothetical protein
MTKAMPAISVWFLYGFEPMYLNVCSTMYLTVFHIYGTMEIIKNVYEYVYE